MYYHRPLSPIIPEITPPWYENGMILVYMCTAAEIRQFDTNPSEKQIILKYPANPVWQISVSRSVEHKYHRTTSMFALDLIPNTGKR